MPLRPMKTDFYNDSFVKQKAMNERYKLLILSPTLDTFSSAKYMNRIARLSGPKLSIYVPEVRFLANLLRIRIDGIPVDVGTEINLHQ